jgi:CarD family transcriptional regulator
MASAFSLVDDGERVTSEVPKDLPDRLSSETDVAGVNDSAGVMHASHPEALPDENEANRNAEPADEDAADIEDAADEEHEDVAAPAPASAAPRAFQVKRGGMDDHRRLPDRLTPAPRPLADEEDHVVYPTHGVGKVERIAIEDIAGHRLELIHITFEENRMKLRVPVAKARSAGLRKLATRKIFDEALAVLKGRARIKRTMWSRRAQEYEAKINSGDPMAIAEVVRDLHRNAGQPDQSFSERQIYEAAMDRLAAELAALDSTDKATAAIKLANFLKTLTSSASKAESQANAPESA